MYYSEEEVNHIHKVDVISVTLHHTKRPRTIYDAFIFKWLFIRFDDYGLFSLYPTSWFIWLGWQGQDLKHDLMEGLYPCADVIPNMKLYHSLYVFIACHLEEVFTLNKTSCRI